MSWSDVLPYFRRAENWEGAAAEERGVGGPLNVSENKVDREIVEAWLEAATAAGYRRTVDYNREDQEGVGYFQMTMKNGRRCSSAAAYLKPARKRSNLHIFTNAHSEKLLIDGNDVTGVPVSYTHLTLPTILLV